MVSVLAFARKATSHDVRKGHYFDIRCVIAPT
jgi:hypothetical protein